MKTDMSSFFMAKKLMLKYNYPFITGTALTKNPLNPYGFNGFRKKHSAYLHMMQCLIEIGNNIFNVFDTNG